MREKIFITIMILIATFHLWGMYEGKLNFSTNLKQGTPVVLQYKNKENSNFVDITAKVSKEGNVIYKLNARTINSFKIKSPENINIKNIKFDGLGKKSIVAISNNEYTDLKLMSLIKIKNWYNFIILTCLGYYLSWWLKNSIRQGFLTQTQTLYKMQNIEFLRIVFTFVILFYHISQGFKFYSTGRYAVEFFFILSGYFFAITYEKIPSMIDLIKKRIIRFTPMIIFCSIINGLFRNEINFSTLSADWLFWSNTGLFNGDSYTVAVWYISVLFWITLFYYYLLKTHKKETVYAIIGILTFFAYVACVRFGWGRIQGLGDKGNIGYIITQSLMRGVGGIGAGLLLAQFCLSHNSKKNLFKIWHYTLAEIGLLILPIISMFYEKLMPSNVMILIVCYIGLIYLFVNKKGYFSQFLDKYNFSKISKYALAAYMSHQPVTLKLLYYFNLYHSSFKSQILGIIVYIISFWLVGIIIHYLIEIPMGKKLKNFFEQI